MEESFAVTVTTAPDGTTVVSVAGSLDTEAKPDLDAVFADAAAGASSEVVVDVSELTFLDSSGISSLLLGRRRLERSGAVLRLRGAHGSVLRALDIAGVLPLFEKDGNGARPRLPGQA